MLQPTEGPPVNSLRIREIVVKPCSRVRPIPADFRQTDVQQCGCFLVCETAEELSFDNVGRFGIDFGQGTQSVVESDQFVAALQRNLACVFNRYFGGFAFCGGVRACAIDQDAPHLLSGNVQKMFAALRFGGPPAKQAQERFIHQNGGLKSRRRRFRTENFARQTVQVIVSGAYEPVTGFLIAVGSGGKQQRQVLLFRGRAHAFALWKADEVWG